MRAYLDHAATSPMPREVREAYLDALGVVGNPASTHQHGQVASETLETARDQIAAALGCDRAETILTGGGTESINLAIKGMFWARQRAGSGPVVLVAAGEHHATFEAAQWLEATQGAHLVEVPIDNAGRIQPAALHAAIVATGAERIALVTLMWANNEVGTVQPVAELCTVAREFGIPVHVDAVAALGQERIDFAASGAAALSVSAHKIGGPVGIGALVLGRRTVADPLLHGGTQQRARSGSQDVAGAVAFAAALALVVEEDGTPRAECVARTRELRDRLIAGVRAIAPEAVLRGPERTPRLSGNAHFTFPGCQGDSLVFLLDAAGVSASVGSACQAGVHEISHVLLAMGVPEGDAAGALRFTLGPDSQAAEVDALLAALPAAISRARVAGLS
ncbi:cysteine desulfurase [Leucobacter exalbidus]|uniref:Cysteine desulfurase n=1 Tax=Leucobacter exalbidus TaxID=662960 RepID=A0A940PSJ1_9MICO|nr:cysteine desulfurase [Leucobacter exalbidus]